MRTNFDFSPYRRSSVGFDRLFDLLETNARGEAAEGYPPFDIQRLGDDSYRITLAVAGFRPEDIEVVAQQNLLTVTGKHSDEAPAGEYLTAESRRAHSSGAFNSPTSLKQAMRSSRTAC